MASVTASSGVKLKASTDSLSGSTTLTGTDNKGNRSTLATITASGKPTKGGSPFSAGTNNGWSLEVTYNDDGTATGKASGTWSGVDWDPNVSVEVDAPGRSRHPRRSKKKSGSTRKASGRTAKKTTKSGSKSRSARRSVRTSARKKAPRRRK